MAAQTARQQATMPYPPLPASPTLTNPDMILPDYDRASSPDRSESPLLMWKNAHAADMQYHLPSSNGFPAGPITPTTPIIYGNGTMLSDIGEVTEVESTVGKTSRPCSPVLSARSDGDAALRSSPTMGLQDMPLKRRSRATLHERRSSMESTSTITTQDNPGLFADFDDSVSVDDSNFQGDDEESVAESFADDTSVQDTQLQPSNGSGLNQDNRYSTSSISRRAEQILANAKRRLTTMEGNLSRARSSLYITSSSLSSDGSTPSPPIVLSANASGPTGSPLMGHSRMPSDNVLQSETKVHSVYPRRSASALGAAGGYRQPLNGSKSMDTLNNGIARSSYKHSLNPLEPSLEALSEDDTGTESQSRRESAQLDSFLSPTFGPGSDKGLTRPASAAQMRELKDHVKDLKGKISSLREQARADSLKRRSLQSLRTPSPFTHAQMDQWYAESKTAEDADSDNVAGGRNPWNGELSSVEDGGAENKAEKAAGVIPEDDEESVISEYEIAPNGLKPPTTNGHAILPAETMAEAEVEAEAEAAVNGVEEDDVDDLRTEDGFEPIEEEDVEQVDVNDDAGYDSESGESTYHDTFQTPVSHEDREDAFDYEHFFLHSAMGTISQQRLGRRGSFSSEDSVETTRGPIVESKMEEIRLKHHERRGSGDTSSTAESFETADEGRNSRVNLVETGEEVATSNGETRPPLTAKRTSFNNSISGDDGLNEMPTVYRRRNSAIYRPTSTTTASLHRPSISSFESTGTNRSFPLVNKPKMTGGILTPQGSPDGELKQISDSLMSETASICERQSINGDSSAAIQMLSREDQLLVERLVASLGKCVLGLSESGRASAESRMFRRRIDGARRILEGVEDVDESL